MIRLYCDGQPVELKIFNFAGGEVQVKILDTTRFGNYKISIHLDFKSNDDLIALALLVDAVRYQYRCKHIELIIPYFPYARQDKRHGKGESLALKVVSNFINSLKFDVVVVYDAHSDVLGALIDNVRIIDLTKCVEPLMAGYCLGEPRLAENLILVSPDAGANKKVQKVSETYGIPFVRADKTRNPETGYLSDTIVYSEHVGDKNFLILDDILDGGRTFINLEKELRKLTNGKVMLYITHGIFSHGLKVLEDAFDTIYCENIMLDDWEEKSDGTLKEI